jgi:hypothetical protein
MAWEQFVVNCVFVIVRESATPRSASTDMICEWLYRQGADDLDLHRASKLGASHNAVPSAGVAC